MEIKKDTLIAVSLKRVWTCLTDVHELTKWIAEDAVVNDQQFLLTGKWLYNGSLGGDIKAWQPEREIAFHWPLAGAVTAVSIRLVSEPQEGVPPADYTRVIVEHSGVPTVFCTRSKSPSELLECIWVMWLRQLRLWLERAEIPSRMDYSASLSPSIERTIVVNRDSKTVWQYIENADLRSRWFDMQMGQELERIEGRLISFQWTLDVESTVTWLLEPLADNRTLVILRHEGLPSEHLLDYNVGWQDYLISLVQKTAVPLIRQSVWIEATPEKVWRFLNTQDGMRRWWNAEMTFEPRLGGRVYSEEYGTGLPGYVIDIVPNQKLTFTFVEEDTHMKLHPFLISIELVQEGDGTRVYLTQSGFDKLPERDAGRIFRSYQHGWADAQELPRLVLAVQNADMGGC